MSRQRRPPADARTGSPASAEAEPLHAVGVIGYGNQGRAQALNLRDRGHEVCVGARAGGGGARAARDDGFTPEPPEAVAAAVSFLALLLPDEVLPDAGPPLASALPDGGTVVLAHGAVLAFELLDVPPGRDVVVVAPSGPGTELRRAVQANVSLPAVLAVHRDASGEAMMRARAYAAGIGCDVSALTVSSVDEEAIVDLFGEQVVLCGGLAELVGRAFDTLVAAGYPPELAHLECVEQLRLTTALISEHGIDGMWSRVSGTARFGGLETGPAVIGEASARAMQEALARIRSGAFFRAFLEDHRSGGARMQAMRRAAYREALEAAGRRARGRETKRKRG